MGCVFVRSCRLSGVGAVGVWKTWRYQKLDDMAQTEALAKAVFAYHAEGQDFSPNLDDHDTNTQVYWTRQAAIYKAEMLRLNTVTTEAELDALPEDTIIRAEEKRDGRRFTIARVFEKMSMRRNEWLELDPSDRNDGEELMPASLIMNYYGTAGATVLYRPEVNA